MKKERFKLIPTSHLVLIKDNKVLLPRRFNTGYEDGNYSIIGGHLDGNETFIQAMIRETKEEIGISIKPEDIEVAHVMHRKCPTHERIDFFFTAKKWEGEPKNMEPNKCDDLQWFDLDKLPKNLVSYVKQAVEKVKENQFYSEHGW